MGISGQWKARQQEPYASELKQGTGWNAVHAIHNGPGRGIATHGTVDTVDPILLDEFQPNDYGYCDEDITSTMFGYGPQTGLSDRPRLGESDARGSIPDDFPAPGGNHKTGIPGGTWLRSKNRGATLRHTAKELQPPSLLSEPYKRAGEVEDAVTSDPSAYEMQTSMRQRDQVRAGSQTPSGRANEYDAPIRSRIPGMRVPTYSEGYRHDEMEPKAQDLIIRPFYPRTAATGRVDWMRTNELYVSEPMQRQPVPDPYTGPEVGTAADYNYTDEDMLPYV